jgi:hypothetical protein
VLNMTMSPTPLPIRLLDFSIDLILSAVLVQALVDMSTGNLAGG